jgi:ubiquitin carboxyl-terminal hydrolase 14
VLDWVTDDLKAKLLPVNTRLKEIEKSRAERRNIRKKTKSVVTPGTPAPTGSAPIALPMVAAGSSVHDVTMSDGADTGPVVTPEPTNAVVHSETIEDEASIRQREATELFDLLPDDFKADVGANYSGLYELVGKWYLEGERQMVA